MLWESLEVYFDEAKEEYSPPLTSKNRLYLEILACLLQRISSQIEYFENDNREYTTIMLKLNESIFLTSQLIIKQDQMESKSSAEHIQNLFNLPFTDKSKLEFFLKDIETFKNDFRTKYPEICSYTTDLESKDIDDCYFSA